MSDITPLVWLLAIAAVLLLVLLLGYAVSLWRRLQAQQRTTAEREASYRALAAQRSNETRDSIAAVCQAMLSGDMVPTETALRVRYLATQAELSEREQQTLQPFHTLAEQASHFPIRQAWDALDKKLKRQYTRERLQLEAAIAEPLQQAAKAWLAGNQPRGIVH